MVSQSVIQQLYGGYYCLGLLCHIAAVPLYTAWLGTSGKDKGSDACVFINVIYFVTKKIKVNYII